MVCNREPSLSEERVDLGGGSSLSEKASSVYNVRYERVLDDPASVMCLGDDAIWGKLLYTLRHGENKETVASVKLFFCVVYYVWRYMSNGFARGADGAPVEKFSFFIWIIGGHKKGGCVFSFWGDLNLNGETLLLIEYR